MIRIFSLLVSLSLSSFAMGQSQKPIYIYFEENSSEMCTIPSEQRGRYHGDKRVKKYKKINSAEKNNYSHQFYICNELFIFANKGKIKKCGIEYLDEIKFSDIQELTTTAYNKNPLYPFKVYPNIYIVEKANENEIYLYAVKWLYYVE